MCDISFRAQTCPCYHAWEFELFLLLPANTVLTHMATCHADCSESRLLLDLSVSKSAG